MKKEFTQQELRAAYDRGDTVLVNYKRIYEVRYSRNVEMSGGYYLAPTSHRGTFGKKGQFNFVNPETLF